MINSGHSLEEIRVRALENIQSKLEHNLICDADIVHEKQLYTRLLEWFNHPECSHKADVLGLIYRLAQVRHFSIFKTNILVAGPLCNVALVMDHPKDSSSLTCSLDSECSCPRCLYCLVSIVALVDSCHFFQELCLSLLFFH